MNTMVASLKEGLQKTEMSFPAFPVYSAMRTTKLTKQAKVSSWSCDMLMETFTKQLETWNEIKEDVPEFAKSYDFIESLKSNKEIKGLPRYVAEHVLPVLEKKVDQKIKKVLELLDVKYGRTRT